ncbi:hypothetical protein LG197_23140 [Pseudomonas asiatica]|uniref:hypothetical protein n=1 Tax=Pseudomonas asiatica TaxID=2219225 RepID=UPI00236829FF|nr:hypothetical protein [Pseudomonas asiatica]WDM87480.1 hypothetical protein LG197_23140 [Pseudomonas asiatica]
MSDPVREQFEAWVSKNYVVPPGVGHLFVRAEIGDGYRLSSINHAWHGWKASREAVVVELPNTECFGEYSQEAASNMRDSCAEAIEEQGMNYKVLP